MSIVINPAQALATLQPQGYTVTPGNLTVAKDVANTRVIVTSPMKSGQPMQAASQRATTEEAFVQTDYLNMNLAAGGVLVVDLGAVHHFFDFSSTIIPAGSIQMLDPNGTPHEFFVWTKLKTTTIDLPGLPPGRYRFTNISGGALTSKAIYVVHTGPRNLA